MKILLRIIPVLFLAAIFAAVALTPAPAACSCSSAKAKAKAANRRKAKSAKAAEKSVKWVKAMKRHNTRTPGSDRQSN